MQNDPIQNSPSLQSLDCSHSHALFSQMSYSRIQDKGLESSNFPFAEPGFLILNHHIYNLPPRIRPSRNLPLRMFPVSEFPRHSFHIYIYICIYVIACSKLSCACSPYYDLCVQKLLYMVALYIFRTQNFVIHNCPILNSLSRFSVFRIDRFRNVRYWPVQYISGQSVQLLLAKSCPFNFARYSILSTAEQPRVSSC